MLPRRTFLAVLLLSALLTAGCGEFAASYYDLRIVQTELLKKFGDEVEVEAVGGSKGATFMVWFVNSPLNDASDQQRRTRAAEAAKVVSQTYPRIHKMTDILVGFLRKESRYVAFNQDQIVALHSFDRNAQPLPERDELRARNLDGIQVTATYSSSNNDTDIAVNGLQLEGEPGGFGVTVLPYFKLIGDARDGKKLPPPKLVEVNFASYAQKPAFKRTVPITFVVDKKDTVKTEGNFVGNDAQFCYLRIPWAEFRRIIGGKELTIKLGDREYLLTPSQLGAIKQMTQYVNE